MPIEIVICSQGRKGHWPVAGQAVPLCRKCIGEGYISQSREIEANYYFRSERSKVIANQMNLALKEIRDQYAKLISEEEGREIRIDVMVELYA